MSAYITPGSEIEGTPRIAPALLVLAGTIVALTLALTVNLLPRVYEVREGDVAAFSIRAPKKASYVSQIRTRTAREQAAAQISPIIELDYALIAQQRRSLSDLLQAISSARSTPNRSLDQRVDAIRQLVAPPLADASLRRIAEMDDTRWTAVAGEGERLLADIMKDRIAEDAVDEVRRTLPFRVSPIFADVDRSIVVELVGRYLKPNVVVNQEATARARREAQDAVAPVVQIYERGQTVVRDGQVIGPLELEALEALGLRNPTLDWQSFAAAGLLVIVLVSTLAGYIWQFDRELLLRDRRMVLLAGMLILAVVAAKMVIPGRPLWVYIMPLPAATMLLAALLEVRLAIVVGGLLAVLVAWIAGGSLEVGTVVLVGCTVGALAAHRQERLSTYFLAGLYVSLAQIAAYTAFFLGSRSDDWTTFTVVAFELGVNGILAALLTVGSVVLVGRLFGILTTMQLLELANPTQPLLRRLLMEAPGTYHHSIMVGNLGERAAEVIGADSLLVRVAAYYHDIGKLERPWAFIENQAEIGENVHDSLDPAMSAQLVAAHVSDGVKLAERYGLPARIREIIPQHHGTRRISFFYQQAAEQTDGRLDESTFSYPGPRPQSREAAILMLADSTEAAARASRDHSPEALEALVERIIRERLEDGQFDDCNLTLRDLTRIKESFVTLLTGIYHARIAYPPSKLDTSNLPALPAATSEVPLQAPK